MNYDTNNHYKISYAIILVILIPFYFINYEVYPGTSMSLINFIFPAIIVGSEYSYIFPRQAMKLYEEILLKSPVEKRYLIIEIIILVSFSTVEIIYFIKGVLWPFIIYLIIYLLWDYVFRKKSIVLGNKNIIIGKKTIPNNLLQSISIEKKKIIIEVDGQSFEINNWIAFKEKKELERILKQITNEIYI